MMEYLARHRNEAEAEPMRVLVLGVETDMSFRIVETPAIESIDHVVELDEEVINVSKRFFESASA